MKNYLRFEQRQLSIRVSHGERLRTMIGSSVQYRRGQTILAAYKGVRSSSVG